MISQVGSSRITLQTFKLTCDSTCGKVHVEEVCVRIGR